MNVLRDNAFSCAFNPFPRILLYEMEYERQSFLDVSSTSV